MNAKIISLDAHRDAAKSATSGTHTASFFRDFDEVQAFMLPEPVWVSEDLTECDYAPQDRLAYAAFFAWFGMDVDLNRCPASLAAGWEHLVGELGAPAAWKVKNPDTFEALCGNWTKVQHEYLDAVMVGDHAKARALVWRTPVGLLVREKMQTPAGSALRDA